MRSIKLVTSIFCRYAPSKAGFVAILVLGIYGSVISYLSGYCLTIYPNTGDEYAIAFQAKIFALGKLWAEAPQFSEFFQNDYVAIYGNKWVGQFPPMASVLQLPGFVTSSPAWWLAVIAIINIMLFWHLSRFFGLSVVGQMIAVVALATSPTFIFHSISYYSHTTALIFVLLSLICSMQFRVYPNTMYALALGLVVGVGLTIRPLTFVLLSPAFLILAYSDAVSMRTLLKHAVVVGAGVLISPLCWLMFNLFVFGHMTPPYWSINSGLFSIVDIFPRVKAYIIETGAWFGPGFFESNTPKIRTHSSVSFSSYFMIAVWAYAVFNALTLKLRTWVVTAIAPMLLLGYGIFSGPTTGRFGGRYLFESLPLLYVSGAFYLSSLFLSSRIKKNVVVAFGLIWIAGNLWVNYGSAVFFHTDNLIRMNLFLSAERALDPGQRAVIFVQHAPVFTKKWYARVEPDLSGRIFVPDFSATENISLLKSLDNPSAFIYKVLSDDDGPILMPYDGK